MPSTHPWQQPRVMRGIVSPRSLGPEFWALLTAMLSCLLALWPEVKRDPEAQSEPLPESWRDQVSD